MEEGHWTEKLKMLVLGAVVGIAVTLVIGFKQDFIVTNATMEEAVQQGAVRALASVCVDEAKRDWTAQHKEMAELKGWDNYKKRDALVNTLVPHLHLSKELSVDVSSKCSQLLG